MKGSDDEQVSAARYQPIYLVHSMWQEASGLYPLRNGHDSVTAGSVLVLIL